VPVECAAASVWQPPQLALAKIGFPFAGSPLRPVAGTIGSWFAVVDTVPMIVFGVGEATPCDPQPANAMAPSTAAAAMSARRGTAQDSNEAVRPPAR
jgi:hypothetical protein